MKYIDIADIIQKSDSKLLRRLPGFVVKLIEKIICQKEMNDAMTTLSDKIGRDFLASMIPYLDLKLEIEGLENLPEKSRCFFAANHPFGIADGLILTYIVTQKYGTLKAIGNDAFMYIPNLRPLIATVNVFGRNPKEYVKALDELYESDTAITHFPAGEVSRKYNGKVQDCPWQKSFITKAISAKRDIVPFHFYGTNSRLFYFVSRLRKLFFIKMNIELIFLPRELFNKHGKAMRVKIGKPIPWQTFDSSMSHAEWAQKVRDHIYELGKSNEQITFNPIKK